MAMNAGVVIVGAGVAGLATAVALKRVGVQSLVLERSDVLRTSGAGFVLSANAWRALDVLEVSSKLTPLYDAIENHYVTDVVTGEVQAVPLVKPGRKDTKHAVRTVQRKALLEALAEELPADWIRFSSKLVSIDQTQVDGEGHIVTVRLEDGAIFKSEMLIGCDGVNSLVANWMGLAAPVHSGRYGFRCLSVYSKGHPHRGLVHQFVDTNKRAIFAPLNEKEFCISISVPHLKQGNIDFEELKKEIIQLHSPNLPLLFKEVVEQSDPSSFSLAPLMFRYPWAIAFGTLSKGGVTVAGDAMHPMTPELLQGGSCSLEDAVILGRHIGNSYLKNGNKLVAADVASVLKKYVRERRWRATIIVAMSYVAGWVQQIFEGNNRMKIMLRNVFYRNSWKIFALVEGFDCGELPKLAST